MLDHRYQPWSCTACGYRMDTASGLDTKDKPQDGDVSFCIMCGEMYFMENNKFRSFTDDELIAMPWDDKVRLGKIAQGIRDFHKKRREEK